MTKTNFTSRIAGVATLLLAALPMAALSTAAHAAPSVKVSDLNLLSPQGAAVLKQRTDHVVYKYCAHRKVATDRAACQRGVRAEIAQKAEVVRQQQLATLTMSFAVR